MIRPSILLVVSCCFGTTPLAQTTEVWHSLQRTRAVWFVDNPNPIGAEVGLSFEPMAWDDAAEQVWDGDAGARLPLATKAWAEFVTYTDLKFGQTKVKAGPYYAVLERTKTGMSFGLLDAAKVRAARLLPGTAGRQPLVASIPLSAEAGVDGPLRAEFRPDPKGGAVTMSIHYGEHTLSAVATVKDSEGAMPIAMPDARIASRIVWPGSSERQPAATIDCGLLPWTDELKAQSEKLRKGQRWRLGKDWATTLDTNVQLVVARKKLAPGSWHLTMEKTEDGWGLAFSDAAEDYAQKLDGFAADHVQPKLVVPLEVDTDRIKTSDLMVLFQVTEQRVRIVIACCGEQFFVPLTLGKA